MWQNDRLRNIRIAAPPFVLAAPRLGTEELTPRPDPIRVHGTMRKTKHRSICRVAADFLLNLIAYNLIRIPKLIAA